MLHTKVPEMELTIEYKLLLLCARTKITEEIEEEIKYLIQQDIDWDYLLKISTKHRLIPLLYFQLNSVCPDSLPSKIMEYLKTYCNENARKNLLLTWGLMKILKLFEYHDIHAIPYKGPVLASLAYRNIALRQFGDIDLLIKKSEIVKAKDVLISSGYKLHNSIHIDDSYYMELEPEYQFIDKSMNFTLEIKWKYSGNFFSLPEPEILSCELENMDINNFKVSTFSTVNHLLILCIHNAKHDWKRLSWICDISEFLKSNRGIDWSEIQEKAGKLHIKRVLMINLILARDLFGLELPFVVLNQINRDQQAMKISSEVKERILVKKDRSPNLFEKFVLDISKREKLKYGLLDSIKCLTKPTYADFQDFPLPKFLYGLYFLIRPFLLIKRYGKNPIE